MNAQVEKAGAFYFGDSGTGDGIISPADGIALQNCISGGNPSYAGVKPPVKDVQDLDGDMYLSPADLDILNAWIQGNYTDPFGVGKPFSIEVSTLTPTVDAGGSVVLRARVYDNPANGNLLATLRPGWGVEFEVLPTSTCPTARLFGFDPTPIPGAGKNQSILDTLVYSYTDSFANLGLVELKAWAMGCNSGDHIYVRVHIPTDLEAGVLGGRFPVALYAPTDIDITVISIRICAGIAIDQADPTSITEGENQTFTATCYYDLPPLIEDCASAATWSVTGDVTNVANLVTANQIPGGNGGSGSVTANLAACGSDTNNIAVVNNDTIMSTLISPSSLTIPEGGNRQMSLIRTWSDDSTEDLTAGTLWSDSCAYGNISAGGLFTAGWVPCEDDEICSISTSPAADNSPVPVTIKNDLTVIIDSLPAGTGGRDRGPP